MGLKGDGVIPASLSSLVPAGQAAEVAGVCRRDINGVHGGGSSAELKGCKKEGVCVGGQLFQRN